MDSGHFYFICLSLTCQVSVFSRLVIGKTHLPFVSLLHPHHLIEKFPRGHTLFVEIYRLVFSFFTDQRYTGCIGFLKIDIKNITFPGLTVNFLTNSSHLPVTFDRIFDILFRDLDNFLGYGKTLVRFNIDIGDFLYCN